MILDHAGVTPNPARDKLTVRMPREERKHIATPTASHVEAAVHLLPSRYRLPALVLDATGMRVGELEALACGDVDEPRVRWRVSQAVAKTGRARRVPVPPVLFDAVTALVAREDRHPDRRVFEPFGADKFRIALTRACTASGVPAPDRRARRPRAGADRSGLVDLRVSEAERGLALASKHDLDCLNVRLGHEHHVVVRLRRSRVALGLWHVLGWCTPGAPSRAKNA
jgi:integrase